MAGVVPDGADGAMLAATFIDNLRGAADRFAAHDVFDEALSPGVKPGYLFSSQYQALGIAEEVDRPECVHPARQFPHAQKVDGTSESPDSRVRAGRYAHVQIA